MKMIIMEMNLILAIRLKEMIYHGCLLKGNIKSLTIRARFIEEEANEELEITEDLENV